MDNKLSKYRSGSIQEVLSISAPLMVAFFSFHFMLFMDRVILARHSIDDMNAAGVISLVVVLFQFLLINVASIAEVMVGRFNGAKRFKELGKPVWQMIWFALMMGIPYHFIGKFTADFFVPDIYGEAGIEYFRVLMSTAFLTPVVVALSSFFIARGKTKVVTYAAIFANILNIALAYIFIFGIKDVIEPNGLVGSAYAVIIATIFQAAILFSFFASPEHIKKFNVLSLNFDYMIMKECIRVGLPNAIGHFIEIACWAAINRYLVEIGSDHISISTIAISFIIAFSFATEAIQKGVIAIASNAIGRNDVSVIPKTIYSAWVLVIIAGMITAIPLLIFPEFTITTFYSDLGSERLMQYAAIALIGSWLFFMFDGITWIYAGVLTSGGDTKFIMFVTALNSWFLAGLPLFLFVTPETPPYFQWLYILPFYSGVNAFCFYLRYRYGKWKQKIA